MSFSSKALLVNLSISQWTGRKLDKKATGTVESTHSTDTKVGNYTKKLLPSAKELEAVQTQASSMRKYFYENTLPWFSDGSRIIASKHYVEFMAEYSKMKQKLDHSVATFIKEYPRLKSVAALKLGDLFQDAEYPTQSELASRFQCEINVMPVPSESDFRTNLLDADKKAFQRKMREVESRAMTECWTRLHDVVKKAAERLSQPDAIFKDALIENILEVCSLLPKLNVNDDAKLEQARVEVERLASGIKPELCRVNETERNETARKLADIQSKMSVFMGFSSEVVEAKIVAARLTGAKFENAVGANLADGIILRGDD